MLRLSGILGVKILFFMKLAEFRVAVFFSHYYYFIYLLFYYLFTVPGIIITVKLS